MSLVKYWENLSVFILKQMKVDSGTVSFICEHLKYGFLHEVLKTGRTRISIFRINFKWFRSRSLWSPKSRQFSIGSLYAATFNTTRKKKKKVGSGGNFSVWRIVNQRYFGNICLMQYSSEWLECGCMHRCMDCWIHIHPGDFIYLGNSYVTLYSKHLRLCFFSSSFDSSYAHMDRKLYLADILLHCELKPESRKTNE